MNLPLKILSVSIVTSLTIAACHIMPGESKLFFKTIEQKDWAGIESYDAREPGIIIISQAEEVENAKGLITEEALQALHEINYDLYFAIIVFQGWKPFLGYSIQINRINRVGNVVNIYSQFHEPKPDMEKNLLVSSPYHLVKLKKTGDWGGETISYTFP
jgi:hypothetical protein